MGYNLYSIARGLISLIMFSDWVLVCLALNCIIVATHPIQMYTNGEKSLVK